MLETVQGIVMVLDSVFPSFGGGGAEAQVATLGRWLKARTIATTVIVPMLAGGPTLASEQVDGLKVVRIRYPKWRLVGSLALLIRLAWLLIANRHRIDAIHAHIGSNMAAVATTVGRLLGKPVIVKMTGLTEMRGGVLDPRAGFSARIKRRLLQRADAIQATSREIADRLTECGFDPQRVHRIPNAVDIQRFDPAGHEAMTAGEPLVAVYIGRLEPEKGVDILIEGWHKAFGSDPAQRLVVVGSGSLDAALKARAAALGIGGQIDFVGQCRTVEQHLARADFGVLASHAEGLSNTMLETLAAGLPMIVSRVSGADDFIDQGGNGWLVTPGDPDHLARQLRATAAIGRDGLRAMGLRARQQVVDRASMDVIGARLVALYGVSKPADAAQRLRAAGRR